MVQFIYPGGRGKNVYYRLKGYIGDQINAILSAVGMNFMKLMRFIEEVLLLFLVMNVVGGRLLQEEPAI